MLLVVGGRRSLSSFVVVCRRCSLCVVCCLLWFVVCGCCSLCRVPCLLFVGVCCLLHIVCCVMFGVRCLLRRLALFVVCVCVLCVGWRLLLGVSC